MKIRVLKWDPVASWVWNVQRKHEPCICCSSPLEATCGQCIFPGHECGIVIGECTHAFHLHCLENWLRNSLTEEDKKMNKVPVCPMCRQDWKEKERSSSKEVST